MESNKQGINLKGQREGQNVSKGKEQDAVKSHRKK
jgi:hypothetical protein